MGDDAEAIVLPLPAVAAHACRAQTVGEASDR
jgi:hypothetical protein